MIMKLKSCNQKCENSIGMNEKMISEMKADFERREKELKNKINQQTEEIEKLQKNKREFEIQYNDMKF